MPLVPEDEPTVEEAHPSSQPLFSIEPEAAAAAGDEMEADLDISDRNPDSNDATDDLKLPITHHVSLQGEDAAPGFDSPLRSPGG